MKRSLLLAITILFGIAGVKSADAQPRRNERVVITTQVSSWSPQSGAVGTLVTLQGSGFTRRTQVLVGGSLVRPVRMAAKSITLKIPPNYGNGDIVLRRPGSADDYLVGRFQVQAYPQISGFAPVSGTTGTRVQLRGRELQGVKRVILGNVPMHIERINPGGGDIIVTVPRGANTGYFTLYDARNNAIKSARPFTIVAPAPVISGVTPSHGPPGTIVRVTGEYLGNDVEAFYGRTRMRVVASGQRSLDLEIPLRAKRSRVIDIRSRRGGQSSRIQFELEYPAFVSAISPTWGKAGSLVQISGRNFMANDRITIGGQPCKIVQLQSNQMSVVIPPGARKGVIALHRGTQVLRTNYSFDVVYPPRIDRLWPNQGSPGTKVTVNGSGFRDSLFFLGKTPIRASWIKGDQQMQFSVPANANGGRFRVVSRGGEVSSPKRFQVWNFPRVQRSSPSRGGAGTQLTIWGTQLSNAQSVLLGTTPLRILSRATDRIVVEIPRRAQSGQISWVAYGQTRSTRLQFTMIPAPIITSFSPQEGGPGTLVTIIGQGFGNKPQVSYGNIPVRIFRRVRNGIQIRIPGNVSKSQLISVRGEGGVVDTNTPFGYVASPTITRFWPLRAKPGTVLHIQGQSLSANTQVSIGQYPAQVLGLDTDGTLRVTIPANLPAAKYSLSLQWRGIQTSSRKALQIDPWAQVSDIRPRVAFSGQTIMLQGSNLQNVRIFFGPNEMPIVKADRHGRRLWVRVPNSARGTSSLTIDDQGKRINTQSQLEIVPTRSRPVDIRDHRRRKPRRPRR